jgi:hypothetical protein
LLKAGKREPCLIKRAWLSFFLAAAALLLVLPETLRAESAGDIAGRARALGLHKERQWHALMHYRPRLLGGPESLVDDRAFFMHPRGKQDPGAELEATVLAIVNGFPAPDGMAAYCRFPARRNWLISRLGLEEGTLPTPECPELEEYLQSVNPKTASLVFPESHMNSPASMFGHSLIRIDSTYESRLISHALNYAAFTNESFGPTYAFRGIFGLYEGYFSFMPYYERINLYSNMENRDIWEYRLNLTEDEVMMMALHAWEMRDMHSYYYFFGENCSFTLLFMLEAARPEVNVLDGLGQGVIPINTIRAAKREGLIEETIYRPSRAARLTHISSLSTLEDRSLSRAIALGEAAPQRAVEDEGDKTRSIRVLDMATEFLKYRFEQQKTGKEEYTPRLLQILAARSGLGPHEYDVPTPPRPESGHGSSRLALAAGRIEDEDFLMLRLRPAFHDLTDPDRGFARGAAISFLETEIRHLKDQDKTVLDRFGFVDITSLAPIGDFFREVSWKIESGLEREELSGGEARTPAMLYVAMGYSLEAPGGGIIYALAGPEAKAGGELDRNHSAGARATAGLMVSAGNRYRAVIEADAAYHRTGHLHESHSIDLKQTLTLGKDLSATLLARRQGIEHIWSTEASLALNLYF